LIGEELKKIREEIQALDRAYSTGIRSWWIAYLMVGWIITRAFAPIYSWVFSGAFWMTVIIVFIWVGITPSTNKLWERYYKLVEKKLGDLEKEMK